MKLLKYKKHFIIKTNTTTTVFVQGSIGYRPSIRYLYKVDGPNMQTGPKFTTIQKAKEFISAELWSINNDN